MWPFKKKAEEPKLKILEVPEDKVLELLQLIDIFYATPRNQDHVARYNQWKFVEDLFPETKGSRRWTIDSGAPTQIFIRETM